jgi:hypothetical protein
MKGSPLYQALMLALREAARIQGEANLRNEKVEVAIHAAPDSWRALKAELGTGEFASMGPASWLIGVEPVPDGTVEPGTIRVQTRKVFR